MSLPNINIVELIQEGDRVEQARGLVQFEVVEGIHEEIREFVQKKLSESLQVQHFRIEKEIDFLQKYLAFLKNRSDGLNNQNELEELGVPDFSPSEKQAAIGESERRLAALLAEQITLRLHEQNATESLSSIRLNQIKISNFDGETTFKLTANSSIALRQLTSILWKLTGVIEENRMESSFWMTEIKSLFAKLDENEQLIAIEALVRIACARTEDFPDSVHINIICTFFEDERYKSHILTFFGQVFATLHSEHNEKKVAAVGTLCHFFAKIDVNDTVYKTKFATLIRTQVVRILETEELDASDWISIIESFDIVCSHSGTLITEFESIFDMFQLRTQSFDREIRSRVTDMQRHRPPSTPALAVEIPLLSAATRPVSPLPTVRNFTVIEHAVTEQLSTVDVEAMRREMEIKLRVEVEEKLRREEQERRAERRRREAEEESERKIREAEEQADRIRRKADEHEARIRREAEEQAERNRLAEEQRVREESQRLKCTFLSNVPIFRGNQQFTSDQLSGKVIGLYYSGEWCPPSLEFTPVLRNFYNQVREHFEVLFISSDNSAAEMSHYLQNYHGNWFYLQFRSQESIHLSENVKSLPTLLIVRPNGQVISYDGRNEVTNCQNPHELVNQWRRML